MKKINYFICFLLLALGMRAQNNVNLVVFSEDGDPFYAYVNGIKQNDKAESNVKVTGVTPNISLRIQFENKALPVLKQNMALEPGFEHTAKIKRDKNQQLKLRHFGQVPLAEAHTEEISAVEYHTSESAVADQPTVGAEEPTSVTSTTTTTQIHSGNSSTPAVNISMPGVNISMQENQSSGQVRMQTSTSTTVTQTTTTKAAKPAPAQTVTPVPAGCSTPMTSSAFAKMKQSIESKPFSDTKMSTAKVATKSACLSVNQVKEICKLFSMDEDKLTYAKYAYNSCVDKANFYQVSEVFAFSTTTEDLNKFLEQ